MSGAARRPCRRRARCSRSHSVRRWAAREDLLLEGRRRGRIRRELGALAVSLPLEGIRVLDLSRLLPGGFCSLLLADFGAEVLKVEDTGMGDYIRWSSPFYEGAHPSAA